MASVGVPRGWIQTEWQRDRTQMCSPPVLQIGQLQKPQNGVTRGQQLEKLLRVLEEKREAYVLPHMCARCVDRPWNAMARLRSTINGIDDWNRLFELVEKQGPWGPAGCGLWLLGYGSDLMSSSRFSKSTTWTMNYAELRRAMKEPLSAAGSLHDLQGLQVKPLWA